MSKYICQNGCYRFILSCDDSIKGDEIWIMFCMWCAGNYFADCGIKPNEIEWDKWGFKIRSDMMKDDVAAEFISRYGDSFEKISEIMANSDKFGNDVKWYENFEFRLSSDFIKEIVESMRCSIKIKNRGEEKT